MGSGPGSAESADFGDRYKNPLFAAGKAATAPLRKNVSYTDLECLLCCTRETLL
jgi:hypothetical protein